jgi:beta-lactamase superfamily II metal-dependent hydrolase
MAIRFIGTETAGLFASQTANKPFKALLWGDRVRTMSTSGSRTKVKARGAEGWVDNSSLTTESLLEIYFIDVGQGDGVLIRTPDHRHILIDGGWPRANQDTGKNAADFVDWKFAKDYGQASIELDAVIASHNDADHYGGLWDLLNVDLSDELDAKRVHVDAFYHAGVSWWKTSTRKRFVGESVTATDGNKYLTQLLGDRSDALDKLPPGGGLRLQGEWAQFIRSVTETRKRNGTTPTPIRRLSDVTGLLPGFEGGDEPVPGVRHGDVAIHILGPVEFEIGGKPALRDLGGSSQNTNGNSSMLRIDYGRTRIMMTGDLNANSQRVLLDAYEGQRLELQCDVAKACHHGSDDISYEFLQAMNPAVTVISSGDNEGHDHPRPAIVAASATTGHLEIRNDELVTPLVYMTEIARSVSFGSPSEVAVKSGNSTIKLTGADLKNVRVTYKETKAGERKPRTRSKTMADSKIVAGLTYGLVNVRTNGQKILCATMDEKGDGWQIKTIESRF